MLARTDVKTPADALPKLARVKKLRETAVSISNTCPDITRRFQKMTIPRVQLPSKPASVRERTLKPIETTHQSGITGQ